MASSGVSVTPNHRVRKTSGRISTEVTGSASRMWVAKVKKASSVKINAQRK